MSNEINLKKKPSIEDLGLPIITIDGFKLAYSEYYSSDSYSTSKGTNFYNEVRIIKKRKYGLFGSWITKYEGVILFTLYDIHITDPHRTREKNRSDIMVKLSVIKQFQKRKEEIKKGDVI